MEFKKKKLPTYIMAGMVVFTLLWFNVAYFNHRISSNPQSISEYDLSDEDIAPQAEAATASVFYPANIYQTDNNNDGKIEQSSPAMRHCPKIVVTPHKGYRSATEIADAAYKSLLPCRDKIKNVFVLSAAHNKKNNLFLPADNMIKTPLGELAINQKIVSNLLSKDIFKSSALLFKHKNPLRIQLPFLQRHLNSFRIIPILYGEVDYQSIVDNLQNLLKEKGNILVASVDFAADCQSEAQDAEEEQSFSQNKECDDIGIRAVLGMAYNLGLVPQILDVTISENAITNFDKDKFKGWVYDETVEQKILQGTELYYHNLQNFVKHHHDDLVNVIKSSLRSAEKHRHYRIKRKNYNNYLFNQGASFVTLRLKNNSKIVFGSAYAYKAVAADIADNIYHVLSDKKNLKKIKGKQADLVVELLTEPEELTFLSYDDLLSQITPKADGLIIQSGEREGILLPDYWNEIESKDAFVTELKLKAGLSPTYWNDEVKVFRFRTVEIK